MYSNRKSLLCLALFIFLVPRGVFAALSISSIGAPAYSQNINKFLMDGNNLWISTTNSGIVKVDATTLDFTTAQQVTDAEGLIANEITNVVSAFGKLFVATNAGLSIISGDQITNSDSMLEISLANCKVATNGSVLLILGNNESGGLIKYDGKDFKKIFFNKSELGKVADVFVTGDTSWFITNSAKLYSIANVAQGSKTDWNSAEAPAGLFAEPFKIKKMLNDARNVIWIITENSIYYYDGTTYALLERPELSGVSITDIAISAGEFKYFSTITGAVAYVNGRSLSFNMNNGLSSNNISAMTAIGEYLYIATASGIDRLLISSLENDRVECLSCHTLGENGGLYENIDSEFVGVGAIMENPNVKSGHKIIYSSEFDLSSQDNNECLKCHGRMHPNDDSIVMNIDNGMSYAKGSSMRGFCLSCHDYAMMDSALSFNHQLNSTVPKNVAEYYNISGHGASASLSNGEAEISDYDCYACHDYHSSRNAYLISKEVDFPVTKDQVVNATIRDAFCSTRCHKTIINPEKRTVVDHTFEKNIDEEKDFSGCPEEPCDTHPTNSPIPIEEDGRRFKYPSKKLPLSEYDSYDELNVGFMVCTTCHDPHGTDPHNESNDDKQMIRLEWTEFNTLCNECHK